MPEVRPLRSTLLTAHENLSQVSNQIISTIHGSEIALSVLSKLVGAVLLIAIFSIIIAWQFKIRTSRLHVLQLIVSANYVALTILNNAVRLPSNSDHFYSIRIYSLSLLTILQISHLFGHWKNYRSFLHSIFPYHICFAFQCCLLPGCWELLFKFSEESGEGFVEILMFFLFIIFTFWMMFGLVAPDSAMQAREKQVSQEDKSFFERKFVIANIYTLSFDTIFLVCIQYA
jgi:hypothetical protein